MPSNVWQGQLTFGLVSIPVKLLRAARRERVRLQYVHRPEDSEPEPDEPEDHPAPFTQAPSARPQNQETREPAPEQPPAFAPVTRVRQSLVTTADEQPVSRAELLKGYEVEPDRYVVLDSEELKGLRRKTSPTMEIVRSVLLSEIDPVFFETSYYLVPGRGGEKAYAILFAALRKTGHVALAKVGMYGREHVIVIRPGKFGMLAHTMFYTDEIRFENEFRTDVEPVGAKELELAKMFLDALEAPFSPEEFKDVYREELQAMIAKKMAEANVSAAGPPPVAAPPPVADILEALRKSIEMKRKPAQSETQSSAAQKTPGRVAETKAKQQVRKAH
jgi:DNA end-binding protein Ku